MKIVLFMDNPVIPTGYASTCRLTAYELMKRGHEVYAMAFNGGGGFDDISEWNGIKVVPNHALKRDPNAIYGDPELVIKVYNEIKPDILFFHNDSYRYAYLEHVPEEILKKSVYWLPFEGTIPDMGGVKLFDKVAATRFVTNHAMEMHREHLAGKDIGVIPHAVDMANLGPSGDKRSLKASKNIGIGDKFVVCRVDRHQPRKYWDRTLKAFAKFSEGKDDVFLLAKCDPRDITMYKAETGEGVDLGKIAADLGITEKVRFDDFFFDDSFMADAFYRPADVFVTTTSGEGFGLTLCEAMACGTPVIYPDTPVLPEVIGDGGVKYETDGRLYYEPMHVWHNLASIDDAARKLQWAYDDWKSNEGKELAKISERGAEKAKAKYSPDVVYAQWDEVFRKVAERGRMVSVVTVLCNMQGEDQIYGDDGIDKFRETMEKYVTTPYEWIIVDNGSPARDVTRGWMKKAASGNPRIRPVYSDVNLGFAGGNNLGISKTAGKWVVLSNPDSEVLDHRAHGLDKDYLQFMVDIAKGDPSIGIVGMEINERPDILPDSKFPYFCNVLITKECLNATKLADGKWLDETFWPAYYEDLEYCMRAEARGFKIVEDKHVPFYHKSGGTNKYAIEGGAEGPYVAPLRDALERLREERPDMVDWDRKARELDTRGMQGLIDGNIQQLNERYGTAARSRIKLVWHTHVGDGVGFSQIVEGIAPALEDVGFDVYVNDWSNKRNVEDPRVMKLIEKHDRADLAGELDDAIHVVCWLMETFLDVDATYKIGLSFCESTKVRDSYLKACNSMDRILTFSKFCKNTQLNSGYAVPIDVINPGVHPIYLNYHDRPALKAGWGHDGAPPAGPAGPEDFKFLNVGVSQGRKNTENLVKAFCEAFPKGASHPPECEESFPVKPANVQLILKSNNFGDLGWVEPYKRRANIRTIFTGNKHGNSERPDFTMKEMYDLYCEADAYVHPSHGEGIGMPICESAATGLPVIFTNWSSPAEYFDESNSMPISLSPYPGTTFTKAYPGAPGDNGVWANCHIGHLKFLMYQAIRDRAGTKAKGKAAAEHMARNFTWEKTARDMVPLVFEWERDRAGKAKKVTFDPLTYEKPEMEPVSRGDRVLVDIVTRDRHSYLCSLLQSLLTQTNKEWDVIIQCDDSDESMPNDPQIMSMMARCQHEGHGWRIIRSHRQGPHVAHDRSLQMAADDPNYKYKLVCRIDDDITLEPDYLEKLYGVFLADEACEVAAVGGVYLDPRRPDGDQTAPEGFEGDINYSGKIEPNVMWPFVCRYPDGTPPRPVEHLYSSFMYRVEVATSIGGYCKRFSQIGHREESDFSYRFCLAGFKQYIHPEAVGYHYFAPAGGIRAMDIAEKKRLAERDHQIYEQRLSKWRRRAEQRKTRDAAPLAGKAEKAEAPRSENPKRAPKLIKGPPRPGDGRAQREADPAGPVKHDGGGPAGHGVLCVINAGDDGEAAKRAVERFSAYADEVYVTCGEGASEALAEARGSLPKLRSVVTSPDDAAMLAKNVASEGDHEFVLSVSDTMEFQADPTGIIDEGHDDYVFEVYKTYVPGRAARDISGNIVFVQDESMGRVIGPEVENRCLLYRRRKGREKPDMDRVYYADSIVIDDVRNVPVDGKSTMGNELVPVADMDRIPWRKICVYQYPEGRLDIPRYKDVSPDAAPLVSIVIPTHGRLQHLKRCLHTIRSKTTTPHEVIVVDNGSEDGTAEFLERESATWGLRAIRQKANLGYQRAVNVGAAKARGEYILLFNDDAWVERRLPDGRDWLRGLIDGLEEDPDVALAGAHGDRSPALGIDMLFFWCVIMRRSTWDEVGPLDDATFFNYGGDDDYCMRVRQAGGKVRAMGELFEGTLRHLMNLEPEEERRAELEASRLKLQQKYGTMNAPAPA